MINRKIILDAYKKGPEAVIPLKESRRLLKIYGIASSNMLIAS
ncbi:hypothetical protein [Bacillus thuringiensis]|nr:hypothetical protein [Bacillus thuringiensis]